MATIVIHKKTTSKLFRRIIIGASIAILLCMATNAAITLGWAGLGGFASELRIDRAGEANSSVVISRNDTAGASTIVGLGGRVQTNAATGIVSTQATLNGSLSSLNGFPSVTVWFEWGQAGLTNSTGIQTVSATGSITAVISLAGQDPSIPVNFELVSNADGDTRGGVKSFYLPSPTSSTSATSTPTNIISAVLPIAIAVCVIVGVVMNFTSPTRIVAIIGAGGITYLLTRYLIQALW